MAFKVFVSHSAKDNDIVNSLYSVLKQNGIQVYTSILSPETGKRISKRIETGMRTSDCVLVLITVNSKISPVFQKEIEMAKRLRKPIIPVIEEGAHIPGFLRQTNYIEFDREDPMKTMEHIRDYFLRWKRKKEQTVSFGLGLAALLLGLIVLATIVGSKE